MIVVGSKPFGGWRSHQSNRFDNKKALREECFYNKTVSLFVGYFPMQHIYITDYQWPFILIGTTSVLTNTQNVGTNANRCVSLFCIYVLYRFFLALL